jgi:glyoxylase-like metal-dependent hydrolase (beta-lactamase superfamily II)
MFSNRALPPLRCLFSVLSIVVAAAASAQSPKEGERPATAQSPAMLTVDLVKTGLYLISGGGSNTLMRLSANGLILVDGKRPGNYRPLLSQVRKINKLSDLPTRALILTNHHEGHSGTNAQFQAAGIPLLVQQNAKNRLAAFQPAAGTDAPPVIGFDRDYKLQLGGVEVELMHFGNAFTNGDSVVYFTNLKVIAIGDLFTSGTPEPDFSAGGSLVGWGPVLSQVLKIDFDVAVPSAGSMVNRADLEVFKRKLDTVVARARALVRQGVPKNSLMAQLKTDDLGWSFDFAGEQLDRFYAELAEGEAQ